MVYGSDGGPKVKVYKDQGSSFMRCHDIESYQESILILQQDETIADGSYRERFASGSVAIGSRYFRRSGREEDRIYRFYRDNESGDIYYSDLILGKDNNWRYLAEYRFNPETLEWTNIDNDSDSDE